MRRVLVAAVSLALVGLLSVCGALPQSLAEVERYTFLDYTAEFGKRYATTAEYYGRLQRFEQRKQRILAHNRQPGVAYRKGFNAMTDRYDDEIFAARFDPRRAMAAATGAISAARPAVAVPPPAGASGDERRGDAPESFSWQDAEPPVLTAVKRQGHCGSCWAHSATQALESAVAIRFGVLANLSTQQVTACTPNERQCGGTGGCFGGTVQIAWDYVASTGGLLAEEAYPYTSGEGDAGVCEAAARRRGPPAARPVATVVSHTQLPANDAGAVEAALWDVGPLAVSVDATDWVEYAGGIFSDCGTGGANITINHGVQLVGYGVDETTGVRYWTIRNSWGPEWGEGGFIRLYRAPPSQLEECRYVNDWNAIGGGCASDAEETVVGCGKCGVLYDAAYPTVDLLPVVPGGRYLWPVLAGAAAVAVVAVGLVAYAVWRCWGGGRRDGYTTPDDAAVVEETEPLARPSETTD